MNGKNRALTLTHKVGCSFRLILIFLPAFLFSSNFHEHLFSLPFPENIAEEHRAIFELPDQNDLKERCFSLPGDPKDHLLKLLTFQATSTNQREYERCEEMRKNLLLALPLDAFLRIYERYFQQEPLVNRAVISATATRRFFEQPGKAKKLHRLAQKYGSQLVYRVSLQRTRLLEKGIELSDEVIEQLKKRQIGGIDLVGSLSEAKHIYPQTKEEMCRQLAALFDFTAQNRLVVVLHLFEGVSESPFYDALKEVLQSWSRPLYIEVGHIARLTPNWIDLFASNPHLHLLFHVNPTSNRLLHDISLRQLNQTVQTLLARGFPVALGSDGRGILPASSYLEQKELFSCALSPVSFLSNPYLATKPFSLLLTGMEVCHGKRGCSSHR